MPNRRKVLIGLGGSVALAGCTGDTDEEEPEEEPEEEEPEPEPASFAIQNVSFEPKNVVQGYSNINIEVTLLNEGGEGSQQLSVNIAEDYIDEQQVELLEGEEKTISISEIQSDEIEIGPNNCSIDTESSSFSSTIYIAPSDESTHEGSFALFDFNLRDGMIYIIPEEMELDLENNSVDIFYKNDGFGNFGTTSNDVYPILHTLYQVVESQDWWLDEFNFYYEADQDLPNPEEGSGRWKADIEWIHEIIKDEDNMSEMVEKAEDTVVRD